jgi:hypothetical protein
MYRLHSLVVEVYSEQPHSSMVYGKESHGYRLPRQSAVGFRGSLELGSVTEREHEALLSNFVQISLMDENHRFRDQSSTAKIAGSSSSEGAATTVERLSVECQRELASKFKM